MSTVVVVAGKVSHGTGKVSHGTGKVSHGSWKVSQGAGKVSHGAGRVSHGAKKVSHGAGKVFTVYTRLHSTLSTVYCLLCHYQIIEEILHWLAIPFPLT